MRVKLEPRWVKQLLSLPESGMGYQRVDLKFEDGRQLSDVLVFNGLEVELPPELALARVAAVRIHE